MLLQSACNVRVSERTSERQAVFAAGRGRELAVQVSNLLRYSRHQSAIVAAAAAEPTSRPVYVGIVGARVYGSCKTAASGSCCKQRVVW